LLAAASRRTGAAAKATTGTTAKSDCGVPRVLLEVHWVKQHARAVEHVARVLLGEATFEHVAILFTQLATSVVAAFRALLIESCGLLRFVAAQVGEQVVGRQVARCDDVHARASRRVRNLDAQVVLVGCKLLHLQWSGWR